MLYTLQDRKRAAQEEEQEEQPEVRRSKRARVVAGTVGAATEAEVTAEIGGETAEKRQTGGEDPDFDVRMFPFCAPALRFSYVLIINIFFTISD